MMCDPAAERSTARRDGRGRAGLGGGVYTSLEYSLLYSSSCQRRVGVGRGSGVVAGGVRGRVGGGLATDADTPSQLQQDIIMSGARRRLSAAARRRHSPAEGRAAAAPPEHHAAPSLVDLSAAFLWRSGGGCCFVLVVIETFL